MMRDILAPPRRQLRITCASAGTAALVALGCVALVARPAVDHAPNDEQSARQAQVQQALRDQERKPAAVARITFQITQTTEFAARSTDQITIIFSDRSWAQASSPPIPLFGEDIAQEFSFSAADFEKSLTLTFSRVVRDLTFLSSRYIRVINHGNEGWGGGAISMSVNGRPELVNVQMRPRKGDPAEGLKGGNRMTWRNRTYWEEELGRLRAKGS